MGMWNKCREVADELTWLLLPCGIDIHGESKFSHIIPYGYVF